MARDRRELERLATELASLTAEERARVLSATIRRIRGAKSDAAAYRAVPPSADEFASEGDPLAWDAEGWDEFDAAR
jgi:hypothetical protein